MNFGYEMFDGGWKIGTSQKKKLWSAPPVLFCFLILPLVKTLAGMRLQCKSDHGILLILQLQSGSSGSNLESGSHSEAGGRQAAGEGVLAGRRTFG